MKKQSGRKAGRAQTLTLPEPDQSRVAVLNSLGSRQSRRSYRHAMEEFITWYCSEPRVALNRSVVLAYRQHLESLRLAPATINLRLAEASRRASIDRLAPHDLRRSCARMCRLAGGEPEQIQFLPGHASVQTTERYLGCEQRIRQTVNDRIDLRPQTGG